jgi:glycosyltransferase involved in cell wall biosynthesis
MRRIAIGPGAGAGFFPTLKQGFDEIGVECDHLLHFPHRFGYVAQDHYLAGAYARALRLRLEGRGLRQAAGRLYVLGVRLLVLLYAIRKCEAFVFSGTGSIFRFYELPLLRLLGKKIVVIYFGSDARPPFLSGPWRDDDGYMTDFAGAHAEAKAMRRAIRRVERYADQIINHTGTDQFFTRDYVRLAVIGLPVRPVEPTGGERPGTGRIKIVHAPSRPFAKGTHVFRRIIEELRAEGHPIDYAELIGVPNERVLAELATCDFVLDELYSDVPMAMLATEAAMLGKPTVVGSYYEAGYERDNPDPERPPSLFVPPEKVKDAVRRLVEDPDYRLALGARARDFVLRERSPAAVARRVLDVIESRIPPSWVSNPARNSYIWGWGLPMAAWRAQLAAYVERNGFGALLLDDKPAVAAKIRERLRSADPPPERG